MFFLLTMLLRILALSLPFIFIVASPLVSLELETEGFDQELTKECPPYFMGNDTFPCWLLSGTCYCFASVKAPNWPMADRQCREGNMTLLSIETISEDQLIKNHILTAINPIPSVNGTEYWTSGRYSETNQRWEWTATGEPMDYTNWFPGQPDFNFSDSCALLYYLTDNRGLWADNSWVHGIPYICEG